MLRSTFCILALALSFASAQTILTYDPTGPQNSGTPVPPTFVAPGFTASSLSQVGLQNFGNTNVWPVGHITTSTTEDGYLTFTLDFGANPAQFVQIQYDKRSYLGNGARTAAVRTSRDGFSSDISTIAVNPSGDQSLTFDVSSLGPVSGSVTFRIFFFNAPVMSDWDDLVSTASGGNGLRVNIVPTLYFMWFFLES
jgi:hypothetical protein